MQAIHFNGSISRIIRSLVIAFICALLLFSYTPAFAQESAPTQGEEQLTGIEKKAQETVKEKPLSLSETEAETNPGENEIQGTADAEKMYRPESSETPGIEQRVRGVLEKIQGKG